MKVSHEDNYIAPEYASIVETRLANEGFLVVSRQVPVFAVEFLVFFLEDEIGDLGLGPEVCWGR